MNHDDDPAGNPRETEKPEDDLFERLMAKYDRQHRESMLRDLEGVPEPPPPPPPDPSASVSARARRLREKLPEIAASGCHNNLRTEIEELRTLFSDLLLHNAEGRGFDEKFGLTIALRAQKQAVATLLVLEKLQAAENIQNLKKPR